MANRILGIVLAIIGAFAVSGIALHRDEPINALWIVAAAVCIYTLGYRFYGAWIAAKVLSVDATRATPAERLNNGRDFVPTHRWVVFGHHFAAIAGPGPLVGPDAGGAVRLSAGNAVDPGRRGARRLRAGHDHPVPLHPSRRPQPRPDGARRARAVRRLRGADRHADDHGDPDRRARPRGRQRHEAQPVGHLHGGWPPSRSRSSSASTCAHPPRARAGRRRCSAWRCCSSSVWRRRLDRPQRHAARLVRLRGHCRSPGSSSSTACSRRSCRCGCCWRRATTFPRS